MILRTRKLKSGDCGNLIKDGGRPADISSCNVPCAGKKTEFCGGHTGQRVLIYERTPFVIPTAVPKVRRWQSIGCWRYEIT